MDMNTNNPQTRAAQKLGSSWTLGWGQHSTQQGLHSPRIKKYHNQSQVQFQDKALHFQQKEKMNKQKKQQSQEQWNKKLPSFDPKLGNRTSIHFGDDKVDYRHKNQVYSTRQVEKKSQITNSQIKFG